MVVKLKSRLLKEARYLEHISIAVVGVLHHHRLGSGQSVRDAVLVFVAYGLAEQNKSRTDDHDEGKRERRDTHEWTFETKPPANAS